MKHLFVPYEEAIKLKELGFDEQCFGGYYPYKVAFELCIFQDENEESDHKNIILQAPLFQQAFDWFREKYNLYYVIQPYDNIDTHGISYYFIIKEIKEKKDSINYYKEVEKVCDDKSFNTFEEAQLACLQQLISLIS